MKANLQQELERAARPIETATGLSNSFYIDDDVFKREQRAVFFSQWCGVGFAKDAPNPGDATPLTFLGMPLLLVRDRDNKLRVFQNTCRHRGMILVEEASNIGGAIRCPYHSWCYGLDGSLKSTPHVGGPGNNAHDSIKLDTLGLYEIRAEIYLGVVFVNIDGKADKFEVQQSELIQRWSEFSKPVYHGGQDSSFKLEVNCNWKLAVENYCESYHLPWIHPGLNSYSRLEDHYNILSESGHAGQGTLVYKPTLGEANLGFKDFDNLSDKWDSSAEYLALFPNVLLGVHRDHTFAIVLEPTSVGTTLEHVELFYADEAMVDSSYDNLRRDNAKLWKEVFKEDIFVVEGMQRGRQGVQFDGGKFSPVMDNATHCFHQWVANKMMHDTA